MNKIVPALVSALLFCMSAQVESYFGYSDNLSPVTGFYGEIFGGGNLLQAQNWDEFKSKQRNGYIISGSYGYHWCSAVRIEAEYAYRRNPLKDLHVKRFNNQRHFKRSNADNRHHKHFVINRGTLQNSSIMGNLIIDLPLGNCNCGGLQVFAGGGVGYDFQQIRARRKGDAFDKCNKEFRFTECKKGPSFKRTTRGFAWQLIAGLSCPVYCGIKISVEYKFHKGNWNHLYNHSVGIGLSYEFGSFYY